MNRRQSTRTIVRDANALAQLWKGHDRYGAPSEALAEFHRQREWREPQRRIRLNVPFSEQDAAKAQGAKWDPVERTWYAFVLTDGLRKWLPVKPDSLPPLVVPNKARKPAQRGRRRMPKATPKEGFQLYDGLDNRE